MKKYLLAIFAAALLALSLCACSSSSSSESSSEDSSSTETSTLTDSLIEHRVFLTDSGEGYDEYMVVFYGSDTKKLVQLNDQTLFDTSAGYTVDSLGDTASIVENVYPGSTEMGFCAIETLETDDYISILVSFSKLDQKANWTTLADSGIVVPDEEDYSKLDVLDADSLCDSIIANGGTEISMADDVYQVLDFTVR